MPQPNPSARLDVSYSYPVDVDTVGEHRNKQKADAQRRKLEDAAFVDGMKQGALGRLCGGDLTLMQYLGEELAALVRQEHIDRAQARRYQASLSHPKADAERRLEYLRIEMRHEPPAMMQGLLDRDGFARISLQDVRPIVFYGEGDLRLYKSRVARPDIVEVCEIAPGSVRAPTPPTPTPSPPPERVGGQPRLRLDKVHGSARLRDDYRTIIARRGRANLSDIIEDLTRDYGLGRVESGTVAKVEQTLLAMVARGELTRASDGMFGLPTADRGGSSDEDAGRQVEGGDLDAVGIDDDGQHAGSEARPNQAEVLARQPEVLKPPLPAPTQPDPGRMPSSLRRSPTERLPGQSPFMVPAQGAVPEAEPQGQRSVSP